MSPCVCRADLERIHIERLLGRRSLSDWMLAGSQQWLVRREKLDKQRKELEEMLLIAKACTKKPNMRVWDKAAGCDVWCGRAWPCAGCKDGLKNGDETSE
jgi:hypothetical protein